jgi:hypothetical protein
MDDSLSARSLICSARIRLQEKVVAQAGGMPPEFPDSSLARSQKARVRAGLIRSRELSKDQ